MFDFVDQIYIKKCNKTKKSNISIMGTEETQDMLRKAIDSLVPYGHATITEEGIHIPFNSSSSVLPIKYPFDTIKESPSDYLPEYEGICMIGVIMVVNKTFALNVVFKQTEGEKHPYKILTN